MNDDWEPREWHEEIGEATAIVAGVLVVLVVLAQIAIAHGALQ